MTNRAKHWTALIFLGALLQLNWEMVTAADLPPGAYDRVLASVQEDGRVKVRWESREWLPGQTGFRVERRARATSDGQSGPWQTVGASILRPNFSTAFLKANGFDKLENEKTSFTFIPEADALTAQWADDHRHFLLSMETTWYRWDYAMAFGFATIDTSAPPGRHCEYRVLRVGPAGFDAQPLSRNSGWVPIRFRDIPVPALTDVRITRQSATTKLVAKIVFHAEIAAFLGGGQAVGLVLLKRLPDGGDWMPTEQKERPFRGALVQATEPDLVFRFSTPLTPQEERIVFGVAAVDSFGVMGSEVVPIGVAPRFFQTPNVPELTKLTPRSGSVVIEWQQDIGADNPPQGFLILREVEDQPDTRVTLTDEMLPVGQRMYIDKTLTDAHLGTSMTYLVRAVSMPGAIGPGERDGKRSVDILAGDTLPEAPDKVRVTPGVVGEKGYTLTVSWEHPQAPGAEFLLELLPEKGTDYREMTHVNGVSQTELSLTAQTKSGDWAWCRVRVAPDGIPSTPVRLYIPPSGGDRLSQRPLAGARVQRIGDGSIGQITVSWQDAAHEWTDAYVVTLNDAPTPGLANLGPLVREVSLPGDIHGTIAIQRRSRSGDLSPPLIVDVQSADTQVDPAATGR